MRKSVLELRNKTFLESWRVFMQSVKVHFFIYKQLLTEENLY